MINKLDSVERRYDEIEKLLSDPDVLSDHIHVQSLAKEQATMKKCGFDMQEIPTYQKRTYGSVGNFTRRV